MKRIGIWLDKKMAYIITLEAKGGEHTEVVLSKIEDFRPQGGSGTRFKGGPQDVVQDSKYLEREKHQLKNYFKEIMRFLKDANRILIFGPAETGEKLKKEMLLSYPTLYAKLGDLIKKDSMTKRQMKAFVRDYFSPATSGT
jgi:hypothetical protein